MFSLLFRTVFPIHRQLGDSCLYKSSMGIFLRNLSASSMIEPEKAERFRAVLENYEFSDTQISRLAEVIPNIFSCDPQNIILPKLKFFSSIGVLSSDLPKVIMCNPALLSGSIEKQFIPCYNFLKTLVDSDEDIVRILKRSPRILSCNLKVMEPNVELLGEAGVPESFISYMLTHYPHSVQTKCDKFKRNVDKAMQMGFDPSRMLFIRAVHVLCEISEQAWENRIKVYRSFGLSDTEIVSAFRSHPLCMKLSEEKITRGMEFYVNEMSWSPAKVARCPVALFYNLERRIIPRCRVIKILIEKGFVKEYSTSISFLSISDPQFLTKFVLNYKNDLPEIMDVITLDRSRRIIVGTCLK
ncbi:unnamed protein product [Fraxinus pennsylvanica]|uniref:Uncharacterized protein n=1 Tax=Fraxinus pennsylvanica TaxID=56036 RepID=A0AAD1ZZJ6_9LAMI|nr:unnamed protein product [Fraxinus pennsylvanica]